MKSFLKKLLGKKLYTLLRWSLLNFGVVNLPIILIKYLFNKNLVKINVQSIGISIYIRPGTTDLDVYNEIFGKQELNTKFYPPQTKLIIDGGAYIGLSSIWFALKFPDSIIYAIEPEKSNFEVLKKNTTYFPNIISINCGLWKYKTKLEIVNDYDGFWNFKVNETTNKSGIEAVGIDDILEEHFIERIDVLKLDIEGSEVEIFQNSDSWIKKVQVLIIELHDRFKPGCNEALQNAIKDLNFSKMQIGEKVVLDFTIETK